jgi:predicted outer membrane repeat protein
VNLTNVKVLSNTGGVYALGSVMIQGGSFINNDGIGLYVENDAIINNTSFISNTYGGAWISGTATLIDNWFESNFKSDILGGGGLLVMGVLTASDTTFVNNTAFNRDGGGAAVYGTATLSNCQFISNQVTNGNGGGLYANGPSLLNEVQFINNSARFDGGGLRAFGPITIIGSRFENNLGGGVAAFSSLDITNTQFIDNSATGGGAAIYHGNLIGLDMPIGNARIINTSFTRNRSGSNGSVIYLNAGGEETILHSTIADIELNPVPAIKVMTGTVGITDTIITSHTVAISQTEGTGYQDYNLFFGNTFNVSGTISGGAHDVFGDPNFVDPMAGDYHIVPPSAAINAGVDVGVLTDLDGNPRPTNGGFDIGAYEYSVPTPITGLSVSNSSPTELGSLTFFTATANGTAITYDWDFGDGMTGGSGATTNHQYAAIGAYTATVTATNSISTVVATTPVTITARPIAGLSASNNSPTAIGRPTTLTATVEAGDSVTYTWDFGDGSSLVAGQVVTHTYPFTAQFSFTATVIATNPINTQTATTLLTIVPKRLYLPLMLKSN